ncbi:MAG: response regulator [Candidatus Cloacimonetes bacterium]|nr:response regulator [Candidatus Cloacimonadota bacterium]
MNILIVDDVEINLYMLKTLLVGHNHTVFETANGEEALDLLGKEKVDLIISDILMPVMDGFTLCLEVKKNPLFKNIPFIIYTATYTGNKDEEFALKIGADKFIVKPCEPDLFIQVINDVMQNHNNKTENIANENKDQNDDIYKLYNERLIRKLEHKMFQAEQEIQIRIETEQQLKRNESILNNTQKIAKIGGWELDLIHNQMFWTQEVYDIHGIKNNILISNNPEEIINQSINCYDPEDQKKVENAYKLCIEKAIPYTLECKFTSQTGEQKFVQTGAIPYIQNNKIIKIQGYIMDCTQQKLEQQKQEKLKEQLLQSQKLESLGQLAGGIAHDFNNILNIILGYGELLLHTLPEDFHKINEIQEIVKAGQKAADLTHQLLVFSRKNITEMKIFDINETIKDIKKLLSRLLKENISLTTNLSENLEQIEADPTHIYQILMNLILNARDALPNGGNITIETSNVTVDDKYKNNYYDLQLGKYILLIISDNGIGMPKQIMDKIFEPFFTTKEIGKGTGLGLSTVYGIINQIKGKIYVASKQNKGTIFKIFFPISSKKTIEPDIDYLNDKNILGNGEFILIAEDEKSLKELLDKMLTKLGYNVIAVENGNEALKTINQQMIKPDLLLTDIIMPDMNGVELINNLKQIFPELKVLFMSGYSNIPINSNYKKYPFIQKPFNINNIAIQIKMILKS